MNKVLEKYLKISFPDSRDIARSLSSLREEKEPSSPSDTWKALPGGTPAQNQSKYSTLPSRAVNGGNEIENVSNEEVPSIMHKDGMWYIQCVLLVLWSCLYIKLCQDQNCMTIYSLFQAENEMIVIFFLACCAW